MLLPKKQKVTKMPQVWSQWLKESKRIIAWKNEKLNTGLHFDASEKLSFLFVWKLEKMSSRIFFRTCRPPDFYHLKWPLNTWLISLSKWLPTPSCITLASQMWPKNVLQNFVSIVLFLIMLPPAAARSKSTIKFLEILFQVVLLHRLLSRRDQIYVYCSFQSILISFVPQLRICNINDSKWRSKFTNNRQQFKCTTKNLEVEC